MTSPLFHRPPSTPVLPRAGWMTAPIAGRLAGAALAAAMIGAGVVAEDYRLSFVAEILIWGVFALSFALVYGYAGMLSFAQAIYFGAGCWGFNATYFGLGLHGWWPILGGIAAAMALAVPTGFIATRLRRHHFLIVTVILSVLVTAILSSGHWRWLAGPFVTRSLPHPPVLPLGPFSVNYASDQAAYYATLALVALAVGLARLLVGSPFGKALLAVRDNEMRAALIGLPVNTLRFAMFIIAAGFAGLSGTLYLMLARYSNLEFFEWTYSGKAIVMAMLGGASSLVGPFLGTAFYMILADWLSTYSQQFMIVFGVLLLIVIRFLPDGLWGGVIRLLKHR